MDGQVPCYSNRCFYILGRFLREGIFRFDTLLMRSYLIIWLGLPGRSWWIPIVWEWCDEILKLRSKPSIRKCLNNSERRQSSAATVIHSLIFAGLTRLGDWGQKRFAWGRQTTGGGERTANDIGNNGINDVNKRCKVLKGETWSTISHALWRGEVFFESWSHWWNFFRNKRDWWRSHLGEAWARERFEKSRIGKESKLSRESLK